MASVSHVFSKQMAIIQTASEMHFLNKAHFVVKPLAGFHLAFRQAGKASLCRKLATVDKHWDLGPSCLLFGTLKSSALHSTSYHTSTRSMSPQIEQCGHRHNFTACLVQFFQDGTCRRFHIMMATLIDPRCLSSAQSLHSAHSVVDIEVSNFAVH